jgi:hypothetical protein
MQKIPLWRVELTSTIAFFDQTVIEVVTEPTLINVPYCHPLTHKMLVRDDNWVPVLQLHEQFENLLLLAIPENKESPQLAITLNEYPNKILTNDSEFIEDITLLPSLYKSAAISAIKQNDQIIPILNPTALFSDQWLASALLLMKNKTDILER